MNIIILAMIKEAQSKMSAYNALLGYRFMNMCVKAEVASLLPVTVSTDLAEQNLEEVAMVNQPNEYQLGVFPKNEMFFQNIVDGIALLLMHLVKFFICLVQILLRSIFQGSCQRHLVLTVNLVDVQLTV